MAMYHMKIIELLDVTSFLEKSFIKIKLSFEQELELEFFWEIDDDTANHLKTVITFGEQEQSKYRLSFHRSWDSVKKQNVSFITKTYKDHSEKIYFPCSEEYVKKIKAIKDIQCIEEIGSLNFLYEKLPTEEIDEIEGEQEMKNWTSNIGRFTRNLVTMISAAIIIFFAHAWYDYAHKTVSGEEIYFAEEFITKEITLTEKELLSVNREMTVSSAEGHKIQTVELTELISSKVPKGTVSLTFDDGPSIYTEQIADILGEYHVGGTFFFVGRNVNQYPYAVQYVHERGYSIGSHSYSHINMKPLSNKGQKKELLTAITSIEEIIQEPLEIFRPPFGAYDARMVDLMRQYEQRMVLWNIDPEDWRTNNANKIYSHIRESDISGSIILLHETQAVVDALPKIIEFLQDEGLEIVNLR